MFRVLPYTGRQLSVTQEDHILIPVLAFDTINLLFILLETLRCVNRFFIKFVYINEKT